MKKYDGVEMKLGYLRETADTLRDALMEAEHITAQLKAEVAELDAERKLLVVYAVGLLKADPAAFEALSTAVLLGEVPHTVDAAKTFVADLRKGGGRQQI